MKKAPLDVASAEAGAPSRIESLWSGNSDELIDSLIEDYGAPSDLVTIEVGGKRLSFNAVRDRAHFNSIKRKAREFVTTKASPRPEDTEFFDTDDETKGYAYVLAHVSVQPKFTAVGLLKLAKRAVFAFEEIKDKYLAS